ncbi:MAG: acyl-CoA desaturase [Alphaproteobacteria bacterium]|nr:acyl-CoA desaturase [Alphaproteobacteria bacterium]
MHDLEDQPLEAAPTEDYALEQDRLAAPARGLALLRALPPTGRTFLLAHVVTLAGLLVFGVTWEAALWCVAQYVLMMFGVTAGYHRYFSHRSYKTSRWFQFVLALLAQTTAQRDIIWWAAHHRHHHRYSDQEEDVHSPVQRGLFHAHVGWLISDDADEPRGGVADLERLPELQWLSRWRFLPATAVGVSSWLVAGGPGLFAGFFLGLVLNWHGTFLINSLCHVWGSRRFETTDTSRNNLLLALLTLGEGWHNNHHQYMRSTRQGFAWWEIDLTYYGLKLLEALGLVWDLREPPEALMAQVRAEG